MFRLVGKFKRVKCVLKEWNMKENYYSFKNLDKSKEKFKKAEEKFIKSFLI